MRIPGNPGRSQHRFSAVPSANIPRSVFNRSHGHKTTFNEGYLVPVYIDEALPGDTFNCRMTAFARLSTLLQPIMDNLYLESFFFAVPVRLIWDNWEKFNGAQKNPGDSTSYLVPTVTAPAVGGVPTNSLYDYMGVPTQVNSLVYDNLFGRAYNLIYNEWFRDENLQNSVVVDLDDGPDTFGDYVLLRRGKRHDYFTSSLPFPQKGPAVPLPLGDSAPVLGIGKLNQVFTSGPGGTVYLSNGTTTTYGANDAAIIDAGTADRSAFLQQNPDHPGYPNVYADLSEATAATINQLREAFQIQRMYERDARGGTRYTEILRSHFGVISPDARLQRPEYLGGGHSEVNLHVVPQTSGSGISGQTTPQGDLAAFGTISARGHGFTKSFVEHCVIIGLVCVRADLNYQQGLNRMWSRQTRFDFYWGALSHLGEQAILNKEIYAQGTSADDDVFGYIPRYDEYRYHPSLVSGDFRSNSANTLDSWHLAQDFGSLPGLNSAFIVEDAPMERVLAVANTVPHFLFDSYFSLKCARPMPVHAVPGLIDHF